MVVMNKLLRSDFLMYFLLGCSPILLWLITLTRLDLNMFAMMLFSVVIYFLIYVKQVSIVYGNVITKKIIHIIVWSVLMVVTFPFGCILFSIVNWKKLVEVNGTIQNINNGVDS